MTIMLHCFISVFATSQASGINDIHELYINIRFLYQTRVTSSIARYEPARYSVWRVQSEPYHPDQTKDGRHDEITGPQCHDESNREYKGIYRYIVCPCNTIGN